MNKYRFLSFAVALVAFAAAGSVQAADVVDTAAGVPELSTLVSLVDEAGLVGALKDADDITVFAPTNSAFERLPKFLLRAIENDPDILVSILTYHVVPERLSAAEVVEETSLDTLEGSDIHVRATKKRVFVNTSRITATDIETDNATVHLVNRVLIPWQSIRGDVIAALRH